MILAIDLRKKTDKELIKMRKEAEYLIISSIGVKSKIKPEQRKVPRKLIARINTILKEREL